MTLIIGKFNLFDKLDSDVLFNAANCLGVMGAGIALEFKNRYPLYFADYVKFCKTPGLKMGDCHTYKVPPENAPGNKHQHIISIPTMHAPGTPVTSFDKIEDSIYHAFEDMDIYYREEFDFACCPQLVITTPALGCGIGGGEFKDFVSMLLDVSKRFNHIIQVCRPLE